MIPRGTTHTFELDDGRAVLALLPHARRARDARTATATATGCCSSTRPTRSATSTRPGELETCDERGEFAVTVRVRDGLPGVPARPPPVRRDRVGRLSVPVHVQRRRLRADHRHRVHQPPPIHQTFEAPGFVVCTSPRGCSTPTPRRSRCPTPTRMWRATRCCTTSAGGSAAAPREWKVDVHPPAPARHPARPAPGHHRDSRQQRCEVDGRISRHGGHVPPAAAHARSGATTTSPSTRSPGTPTPSAPARCSRRDSSTRRSPSGDEGVVVHLGRRPPRRQRPANTAPAATRSPRPRSPGAPASRLRRSTTPSREQEVWRIVCRELAPEARALRVPRVPRRGRRARPAARRDPAASTRSARRLEPLTGFRYVPAAGPRAARASSTARSPTASSTRPSTSATGRRRSTRPSRT